MVHLKKRDIIQIMIFEKWPTLLIKDSPKHQESSQIIPCKVTSIHFTYTFTYTLKLPSHFHHVCFPFFSVKKSVVTTFPWRISENRGLQRIRFRHRRRRRRVLFEAWNVHPPCVMIVSLPTSDGFLGWKPTATQKSRGFFSGGWWFFGVVGEFGNGGWFMGKYSQNRILM